MICALIVAAGKGLRMGSEQRKQFMRLNGLPILRHTLQCFERCAQIERLYVVLPAGQIDYCRREILAPGKLTKPVTLVAGGDQRQDSVYNGLQAIDAESGIVLIHDGVRPLVSAALIVDCIAGAQQYQACIPALAATETPKQIAADDFIVGTIPRATLRLAQTPQAFELALIRSAYQAARTHGWRATDDAALLEHMGKAVKVIAGARQNIKITTPEDLLFAEILLARAK